MMKDEFKALVSRAFTHEEYEAIEKVYTFHPSVRDVGGKEQIARLFDDFGIRVILDMLPTAVRAEEIQAERARGLRLVAEADNEMEMLKNWPGSLR